MSVGSRVLTALTVYTAIVMRWPSQGQVSCHWCGLKTMPDIVRLHLRPRSEPSIDGQGPDHVLQAIGAGIIASCMMQMPGWDPVAIYYRYKGAAEAYSEAGGTDSTGRVQARLLSLREKAKNAPPSSAGSVRSSHDWLRENCGLVSQSKFRRRDRDEDAPPQPDFFWVRRLVE